MLHLTPNNQLKITRQGEIVIFRDRVTGRAWSSQLNYLRSIVFGKRMFYYAGEYKALPVGRPPKNKIIMAL